MLNADMKSATSAPLYTIQRTTQASDPAEKPVFFDHELRDV